MDRNETNIDRASGQMPSAGVSSKADRGGGIGVIFTAGMFVGLGITALIAGLAAVLYFSLISGRVTASGNQTVASEDSVVDRDFLSKMQALEDTIDQYYYLEEVTDEELQEGAYRGMLDALGDPYTVYYTKEEFESFMQETEGLYYGIGAYMTQESETGLPMVAGLIPGTPAEAAGLRPDDVVYEVDGESVYGMSLDAAIALIKGPEDTQVTISVQRDGEDDLLDFTMTRARVEAPTVTLTMLDNNMAYIEILEFDDVTVNQFRDALTEARGSGMQGLILDLRGNPGGRLEAVVEMCQMILPEGLIVYTEDKTGHRDEYKCDGKKQLEVPLVVLVDGNSASAAEIMAGAIRDYGVGTLVGTTTFGKGIVQQIIPLRDGSAVKMTISAYYTPKGNNIHGTGIEPDVLCEFDGEAYYGSEDRPDNQLEKAKEVLAQLMGK